MTQLKPQAQRRFEHNRRQSLWMWGGIRILLSKSRPIKFDPAKFKQFALFKERPGDPGPTHIDLKSNPDDLDPSFYTRRPIDSDTRLQFADWVYSHRHNAGSFPIVAEGNLMPLRRGRGRGSKSEFHWAGKIDNLPAVLCTKWLVTHDPVFEKKKAQQGVNSKQAAVMKNSAKVLIQTGSGIVAKLYKGRTEICTAHNTTQTEGKYTVYEFRTDSDSIEGADTDTKGRIYVESKRISASDDYKVRFFRGDEEPVPFETLKIGPLMKSLAFSPDIAGGKTLCPYVDRVRVGGDRGYGLGINYKLSSDVADLKVQFHDRETSGVGDMGGTHSLVMSDYHSSEGGTKKIKWEGFDSSISDEDAGEIYMHPGEAETAGRGVSPVDLVKEGLYKATIEMVLKEDTTQKHKVEILFEVKYESR